METASRVARRQGKKPNSALPATPPLNGIRGNHPDANDLNKATFNIMGNAIWAEIGRALMEELGATIFAAGKPTELKNVSIY
jgi:conserved oligomeric Golgi complex subunit 2